MRDESRKGTMFLATALQLNNSGAPLDMLVMSPILLMFFKFFLIALMIIYVIFSIVVIRQIAIMRQTVITPFSPTIRLFGYMHLLFAVMVLLLFIIIL